MFCETKKYTEYIQVVVDRVQSWVDQNDTIAIHIMTNLLDVKGIPTVRDVRSYLKEKQSGDKNTLLLRVLNPQEADKETHTVQADPNSTDQLCKNFKRGECVN